MRSKDIIITMKLTCLNQYDYFTEEDVVKHDRTFKTMFRGDDVLGIDITTKLGEPLKGGEEGCKIINIAKHLKS